MNTNRNNCRNKGFISLGIALAIAISFVVASGATYVGVKYKKVFEENRKLAEQIAEIQVQSQTEVQPEEVIAADEVIVEAATTTGEESMEEKIEGPVVEKEEVVYINQQPTISAAERKAEIDAAVEKALAEQVKNQTEQSPIDAEEQTEVETVDIDQETMGTDAIFTTNYVTQTFFEDEFTDYGGYEIEISVTAEGDDILIPTGTTDTANTGGIGFHYRIIGDDFVGIQDSKVSSCSVRTGDNCKIKAGKTADIRVTVWLYPDQPGNYGVQFDKITYFQLGVKNIYELDEETAVIYVY